MKIGLAASTLLAITLLGSHRGPVSAVSAPPRPRENAVVRSTALPTRDALTADRAFAGYADGTGYVMTAARIATESGTEIEIYLDYDQRDELLLASSNQLQARSGDGGLLWTYPSVGGALAVGQLDSDPGLEIAATSGHVLDLDTRTVQWTRPEGFGWKLALADIENDGVFQAVEIADVDDDGRLDVVAGTSADFSNARARLLVAPLHATGEDWWWNGPPFDRVRDVAVVRHADGVDLVALLEQAPLQVFDGTTRVLKQTIAGPVTSLASLPWSAGSFALGNRQGQVSVWERRQGRYSLAAKADFGPEAVTGVTPLPDRTWAISQQGRVSLYANLGAPALWTSGRYGSSFGVRVSLWKSIYFIGGAYGVFGFPAPSGVPPLHRPAATPR